MAKSEPTVRIEFHWEPAKKKWLARVVYCGVGLEWRWIENTGAPTRDDARALFRTAVGEAESWLF